ncbi:MAG: tRNA uridine-5-carboxymethylaminomethyl(34) synthesis enzyme MnmG [Halobacteriovoraceae bacterium]|nr:tRNA uridine-5-carboxymethylaminomethyl(34) synthesis enzyme MnmG [Halobacteriovoraceae bacterium]|tara:strand:+ start:425 stop:2266 length:1842 start_codon:yes stop_codon:yes gene_type:complete
MEKFFDIIVVGGGHAGIEAAHIASQFSNLKIAIITLPGLGLGSAPCNPSVGGVGKGQVVRELDALGGLMPKLADLAGIQYRTLNESKGYAVQSTRVQIDKTFYTEVAEKLISEIDNISVIREKVESIVEGDGGFIIKTDCSTWNCKKVIVTVGTFLNGKLHLGKEQTTGGRYGSESSGALSSIFDKVKTAPKRFKTGTPPRLNKETVDLSKLEEQPSDCEVRNFHFLHSPYSRNLQQVSCYLARTNEETIQAIKDNMHDSPMYNGQINAVGARYCPSIEDKVNRYPDKSNHHVFVEPEGLNESTMYPSGISSSLPRAAQERMINSISGLENAKIEVYGYAVEYDVVDTTELSYGLEYKNVEGLYFAGQVNGTSGYEEAAGQGYIAGVNAALSIFDREVFTLSRNESYIGVMIEDLISNLRDEPYRLFTARSENRLYIREDNSIIRLHAKRQSLGLEMAVDKFNSQFIKVYNVMFGLLKEYYVDNSHGFIKNSDLKLPRRMSVSELLKQSKVDPVHLAKEFFNFMGISISEALIWCLAVSNKYEGYINKSAEHNERLKRLDNMKIDWKDLISSENISFECKRRIERIKPVSFGQLKLIEGIRPATLAAVAGKSI